MVFLMILLMLRPCLIEQRMFASVCARSKCCFVRVRSMLQTAASSCKVIHQTFSNGFNCENCFSCRHQIFNMLKISWHQENHHWNCCQTPLRLFVTLTNPDKKTSSHGYTAELQCVRNGPVKVQTSIPLRICGKTWKFLFTDALHPICLSLNKEEWAKMLVSRCAKLVRKYPKRLGTVILEKAGSTK